VLCAVVDQGTNSAAASTLNLSQSAVSQHIAALEQEIGLPLVVRGTRPLELTEAGYVLTRHGRAVTARLDNAEHELAELAGLHRGRLRLGSFPSALATFVPSALSAFRRKESDVALTVVDDHMQRLLPRLVDGQLDLAIGYDHEAINTTPSVLDRTPLFEDTFKLLVQRHHPLAGRERAPALKELAGETWVGGGPTSAWFRIVRHICHSVGIEPRVALMSDDYLAIQAFVAADLGIAVVPGLAVARLAPGVAVRQLRGPVPARRIWVARTRDSFLSAPARSMIELLKQTGARQQAETTTRDSADPR